MKVTNMNSSPKQLQFKGIYQFTVKPQYKEIFEKAVNLNPEIRDKLSYMMYRRDFQKGELKVGDSLISIIFNYLGKTFGITGEEAVTMQKKIFSKSGNPPVGDKILGNSIKGKHFKHSVVDIKRALGESFTELLSEKKLDVDGIEKIEPVMN